MNAAIQYESIEMNAQQRAQALSSPKLAAFLSAVAESDMGVSLQQNETIDLFCPDFPPQVEEEAMFGGKADNILKEIQSFTDLQYSKNKAISCVDCMPNAKGIVAVACIENVSFEERIAQSGKVRSSVILIWNFVDPIHPQAMLEAPNDVTVLKFHPFVPTTLVAGCVNGQILYYDLTALMKGQVAAHAHPQPSADGSDTTRRNTPLVTHTVSSSIEASHRTGVLDLVWLPPSIEFGPKGRLAGNSITSTPSQSFSGLVPSASVKSINGLVHSSSMRQGIAGMGGSQFITTAPDGQILVWDIRFRKDIKEMDLSWAPLFRISLTRADMKEELTLSAISITTQPSNTKLVGATEEGELVVADWGSAETGSRVNAVYPWHHGPVKSLERSPFFEDIVLTVGDWTVAIWKGESGTQPLLASPYSNAGVTVGRWSPTRPGVFFVGHADGSMDVWDLLDKAHLPTLTQQVAPCALVSMEFLAMESSAGRGQMHQFVVGDEAGTLHLLEVPKNIARQAPNEKATVDAFLKREQARMEDSAARFMIR